VFGRGFVWVRRRSGLGGALFGLDGEVAWARALFGLDGEVAWARALFWWAAVFWGGGCVSPGCFVIFLVRGN